MSEHERVRLSDVRRIFRLIGEIRELGAEPSVWRPHSLRGLRRIVSADLIVSSEVHFRTTDHPGVLSVIDIGWVMESGGEPWQLRTERQEKPENYWLVVGRSCGEQTPQSPSVVPVKPAVPLRGGRGFILSQYPLAHLGAVDQLGLHRYGTDSPFMPLEHKLVRIFHVELGRLWKSDALKRAADPTAALPPRLSETLAGILQGESEKQIAYALGLSQHTVHNYVRALHRRFGVSSRAELIAKASADRQTFLPKLSVSAERPGGRAASHKGGAIPPQQPKP